MAYEGVLKIIAVTLKENNPIRKYNNMPYSRYFICFNREYNFTYKMSLHEKIHKLKNSTIIC